MTAKLLFAALLTVPLAAPVVAQDQASGAPQRVRSVLLAPGEDCPKPETDDEIVVCAVSSESPYRIPKMFRDQPDEGATAQSWSRRVELIEDVNRIGLPNSCSPVGTGGQTGCTRQFIRQWAQDRLDRQNKEANTP